MTQPDFDGAVTSYSPQSVAESGARDLNEQPIIVPRARIVETQSPYPFYILPLTIVTLAFLILSLAFTASLLDVGSRPLRVEQLSAITRWGWGLIGLALALLVWGSAILPRASKRGHSMRSIIPALLISLVVCSETVYLLGPALMSHLEDRTTAAERQCAVYLSVLATARLEGVPGPALSGIQMALLKAPVAGLSCARAQGTSNDDLVAAVRGMTGRRLGSAAQAYDTIFIPSVRSLRDAYNEYAAAQLRLVNDILAISAGERQAWQEFLKRLAESGLSVTHVPRTEWARIAAEVRAAGIPVAPDWRPTDNASFMQAVGTTLRRSADAKYNDFVAKHFREPLPPGMDWDSFYRDPTIQRRWRAMIGAPTLAHLAPNMGFLAFRDIVYEPQLDDLMRPQLTDLLSAPDAFGPTGRLASAGRVAVTWAIAPAVLLYVTMLCQLWHLGRLMGFGGAVLLPRMVPSTRWAVALALVTTVFLASTLLHVLGATPEARPTGYYTYERIPIVLEPFWVIGSGLRHWVFLDFGFGYDRSIGRDWDQDPLTLLLHPAP